MCDTIDTLKDIDNLNIATTFECEVNELGKHLNIGKSDFTLICQNIRSIYSNLDDFLITLANVKFEIDVIVLTECRLSSHKPIPLLPGYCAYFTVCQLNQNDGVVVYVKDTIKHNTKEIKLSQASCLQLEILNNTILCIYRSPSTTNTENFVSSLDAHLETLKSKNKGIIITGDININIISKQNEPLHEQKNRMNYLNTLSAHGILAGHSIPTREKNCLDHIMLKINKIKYSATIAILHTTTTDHFTAFLCLSKLKTKPKITKTKSKIDFEKALDYLKQSNIAELLYCNDVDIVIDSLTYKLTQSIKLNTVNSTIPSNRRIIKPWITPGILRCIRNRNKLQLKARNEPFNEYNKIIYIRYRNYCNKIIKQSKRNYERQLLSLSVKNSKLLWRNIKNITYTNNSNSPNVELLNLKSHPSASANFANNYFANIGKHLAEKITNTQLFLNSDMGSHHTQPNSFVLLRTDQNEVHDILMSLRSDSAPGWDDIQTGFLKMANVEVVPVITHLANLCFNKGVFPSSLKRAIITPVYKSGDRDEISNYRPISVLSVITKIIEKLLNTRLIKYLDRFDILSPFQFGFRQGKSTEDAVTALTSEIVEHLDSKKKCISVFLDLKKAFDTVSVPILIYKLQKIGLRGIPLALFRDYLSNRKQQVKLGTYISEKAEVSYGVPQGSVLGPTLFLLYINDLCNMQLKNAKIISYADDTAVIFSGETWEDVRVNAEQGLKQIDRWLRSNILTLNTSKTNYICFSICNGTQPSADFKIKLHNCHTHQFPGACSCPSLQKVAQTKYLGIIVDQRLSWYPHLEFVTNRIRKLIWIFKTLRYVMPRVVAGRRGSDRNLIKEIYISLAQSVLVYCIPIWGGAAKTRFLEIERAQRSLIKVMYFKNMRYPTDLLYQESILLTVRQLYISHTVLRRHNNLPYDPNLINRRRWDRIVNQPKTNTVFAKRQFNSRAAFLYNKLNKEINIYSNLYYDCKKKIINWLQIKNYTETEKLLETIT